MKRKEEMRRVLTMLLVAALMATSACGGMEGDLIPIEDEVPMASKSSPLSPIYIGGPCTELFTKITGTLRCREQDDATFTNQPLRGVKVMFGGSSTHTNALGTFTLQGCFVGGPSSISVRYDGQIETVGVTGVSTQLKVIDGAYNARGEAVTPTDTTRNLRSGTINLVLPAIDSVDCDLWRRGVEALDFYHTEVQATPPAGSLRIKRWGAIYVGTPHAYYDVIAIPTNWVTSNIKRRSRRSTIYHEFGHAIRHVADGSHTHWDGDNFEWVYGRNHSGDEITNMPYAFNEGWANYWGNVSRNYTFAAEGTAAVGIEESDLANWNPPLILPASNFLDWNEWRVAQYLVKLAKEESDALMVEVLVDNPGKIHSLWDFEELYCAKAASSNMYCTGGTPDRRRPGKCPPDYFDTGLYCQYNNIRSKATYGRGIGYAPTGCPSGQEYDAGLCYPKCSSGYDGVGPLCWEACKSGYADHGMTCWRDGSIIGSDNSSCPPEDICGLFHNCSKCPSGYNNDGCSCRRDPHLYGKRSYGRGVGAVPTACKGGYDYDAGLCYVPCTSGYEGVGPVCWKKCPSGWHDHGATCYQDPDTVKKYCP